MTNRSVSRLPSSLSFSRSVSPSVLAFALAAVGSLALGCAQTDDGTISSTDQSVDDALRAVQNCQAQARDCFADGGGMACEEQLRTCLVSAMPDAGKSAHPQHEAGRPDDLPEPDGGHENESEHDGGPANPPPNGGAHPAMPEAAVNALTNPVGNEGGPAVLSCVDDLRACLATDTKPSACAETAQACLRALHDAGPR